MEQYKFKIYSWAPYDVYMLLLDSRPGTGLKPSNNAIKTNAPFYSVYNIKGDSIYKQTSHSLGPMLLDFLLGVKNYNNPYLSFRRSCREGICGSCAMNYNGKNVLACTTEIDKTKSEHVVHPLPHLPVLRDLVVDLNYFYLQHKTVQPWLKRFQFTNFKLLGWFNKKEIIHSKKNRSRLDGLYECILCACCSTSCPSYWWNQTEYLGPAILLQTYRWLIDSRDINTFSRLSKLYDPYKVFRCHSILNCTKVCPKGLNPALAIHKIKTQLDHVSTISSVA